MTPKLDTRDITHLRFLADSLVVQPQKAPELIQIVRDVISVNRCSTDPLLKVLNVLDNEFQNNLELKDIIEKFKQSDDKSISRCGHILYWSQEYYIRTSRFKSL